MCVQDVRVQWQTVFLITAAFYAFSTTFYVLCGSGRLQRWALGGAQQVPVRADGLSPPLRPSDIGSRPHSAVIRQFSSPPSVYASKPITGASEPYSSDTLRRAAELATESAGTAPNHLSPSGDDSDALDRQLSSKSTSSSKTRDDTSAPAAATAATAARHTDHDRDQQPRVRRDQNLSSKRHTKPSQSKLSTANVVPPTTPPPTTPTLSLPASPDEGLRIYESLSESPV